MWEQLAQKISQIAGVAQVSVGGQQKPAIRVQLDPAKLVAKGLSLEDVRASLSVLTVSTAKGSINGDRSSYTIYANDQLPNSKDWNNSVIAFRNGTALRVSDVEHAPSARPENFQASRLGRRQAWRLARDLQAAGRQRHCDRRQSWQRASTPYQCLRRSRYRC